MSRPTDRPNVLVILADQMRTPPPPGVGGMAPDLAEILGFAGDAEGNRFARFFPGMLALRRHAVVLRQHCIASSACTPSRAAMLTGHFGSRTGVTQTDGLGKRGHERRFPWLDAGGIPTMGDWFRAAGYTTHWFGKWHLSDPPSFDLEPWGFGDGERSAPEPHGADPRNLGVYRDPGFAGSVVSFLRGRAPGAKPWLAVASLVNPHDISGFPAPWTPGVEPLSALWKPPGLPAPGTRSLPLAHGRSVELAPDAFPDHCFDPPSTLDEDLGGKPRCQVESAYKVGLALRSRWPRPLRGVCPLPFQLTRDVRGWFRAYGRFYAYLHHLVDREIARILAALRAEGLDERTVVVFTSDHGEHGGAHGGMIHKWHTAYEEIVRVPMVLSSPLLHPDASSMRAVDLPTSHADLLPTLLSLAGASTARDRENLADRIAGHRTAPLVGADLRDAITGRAETVTEADGATREGVLFMSDDAITAPLAGEAPRRRDRAFDREVAWAIERGAPIAPGIVAGPGHVQCVRTPGWKYARYWDPAGTADDEWELYCLARDPEERHNLVGWKDGIAVVKPERIPAGWGMTGPEVEAQRAAMHAMLHGCRRRFL